MSTCGKPNKYPMTGWGQSEKSMAAWLQIILKARIEVPGFPPLLNRHHLPNLEASTLQTKKYRPSKYCTQFDVLSSDRLHTIDTWNLGLLHCDNLKQLLAQLMQKNPFLRACNSYKLKYVLFK